MVDQPGTLSREKLRQIRSLSSRRVRERRGLCLVEGERALAEAARAGSLRYVVLDASVAGAQAPPSAGVPVPVYTLAPELFRTLTDVARSTGRLGVASIPEFFDTPALAKSSGGSCTLLYLDAVQDPANVGALVRSSWALGLNGVVLGPGTADTFGARAVRASAGGVFHVPLAREGTPKVLERLAADGFGVFVAAADGEPCGSVEFPARAVLVVGNEGRGVTPRVSSLGRTVSVPMRTGVDSLNVVVAGSIIAARMVESGRRKQR